MGLLPGGPGNRPRSRARCVRRPRAQVARTEANARGHRLVRSCTRGGDTGMTWAEERARFPVLAKHAYLNAGSVGPLARETLDAMATLRVWEAENGRAGKQYFEEMIARREHVRALLAEQVSVPADRIALTSSTTQGAQITIVGLDLRPGDEVVTTDLEHFGLTGPLLGARCDLRIAELRERPAA